jgi:hypothetical protein
MKYYKFIMSDGNTPQGFGPWDMPKDKHPGKWMNAMPGDLEECTNRAIHVLTKHQLRNWLAPHALICEIEVSGKVVDVHNKCICKSARIKRILPGWKRETGWEALCKIVELSFKYLPSREKRPQKAIAEIRKWIKTGDFSGLRVALDAAALASRTATVDAAIYAARSAARAVLAAALYVAESETQKQTKIICKVAGIK